MDVQPRPRQHRRGARGRRRHAPAHLPRGRPLTGIQLAWERQSFVVSGTDLPEVLAVVPVGALGLGHDLVPMAGTWMRSADEARFTPRFPAATGASYALVARRDHPALAWVEVARVELDAPERLPSTVVESIDPAPGDVPANLLRFTVSFSAEMEEGSAAGHVHLRDESGAELSGALLEMPPELWDHERRRLTVLLEPGRIKRGLQPHVQAGPPLREGGAVILVVDAELRDAQGAPLVREARQTYRVVEPVRSRVDPGSWRVTWPENAQDRLVVRFDRPLDRRLVGRHLRVTDAQGDPVRGRGSLAPDARTWTFAPELSGIPAELHVNARLEDLAGNSVRRVFDRDLERPDDDGIDDREVVLRR